MVSICYSLNVHNLGNVIMQFEYHPCCKKIVHDAGNIVLHPNNINIEDNLEREVDKQH